MAICYLGIGSNLGNRKENIKLAIKKIGALKGNRLVKVSRFYRSSPAGGPAGQPDYLNAALKIETDIPPLSLLKKLKKIEKDLGRVKSVRFGPRKIDLDILLYSDKVVKSRELVIPHPRMFKRDFVIKPLKEII